MLWILESNKLLASESSLREKTFLSSMDALGKGIVKTITSEIHAMSTRVGVINQAAVDALTERINVLRPTGTTPTAPPSDTATTSDDIAKEVPPPPPTPTKKDESPEGDKPPRRSSSGTTEGSLP